jgi:hypothetical protein
MLRLLVTADFTPRKPQQVLPRLRVHLCGSGGYRHINTTAASASSAPSCSSPIPPVDHRYRLGNGLYGLEQFRDGLSPGDGP